jgi:predicted amidohydrolase
MLSVGIAQIPNSVDVAKNFEAINVHLQKFAKENVDLVLFPECSLSGFAATMRECTEAVLSPYLEKIQTWTQQTGIDVVLPTAIAEEEKVFNSGFWFTKNERQRFYKIGLTDSEKTFFSIPADWGAKVIQTKGYNLAILVCFEMEHDAWTYFKKDQADLILWPGYWGWTVDDAWTTTKDQGKPNTIFSNMSVWKMPILQCNFSHNDLQGHKGAGPEGLSFVIDQNNELVHKGAHLKPEGYVVSLDKNGSQTIIRSCRSV